MIYMLRQRRLTLLDPARWDDRNDAAFLAEYKRRKRAAAVLALCFFQTPEKRHYWRGYADGMDGAAVEFRAERLLPALENVHNVAHGHVEYRTLQDVREKPLKVDDLPFIKRKAYEDEEEYRVTYTDKEKSIDFLDCDIDLNCILRVTLSPRLPQRFLDVVRQTLQGIAGCGELKVIRSRLIESEAWQECAYGAKR
ncbi:MAG: DUF2971 domain-containing protein [Gammaproteobacteria bacterium]|nr:DUF2971 domain-containing protein [Gammaproteobacteria bacterium]